MPLTLPEIYCKPENIVALMHANSHFFLDELRTNCANEVSISLVPKVTYEPFTIGRPNTLLNISNELSRPFMIANLARRPLSLKHSRCSMLYCNEFSNFVSKKKKKLRKCDCIQVARCANKNKCITY